MCLADCESTNPIWQRYHWGPFLHWTFTHCEIEGTVAFSVLKIHCHTFLLQIEMGWRCQKVNWLVTAQAMLQVVIDLFTSSDINATEETNKTTTKAKKLFWTSITKSCQNESKMLFVKPSQCQKMVSRCKTVSDLTKLQMAMDILHGILWLMIEILDLTL